MVRNHNQYKKLLVRVHWLCHNWKRLWIVLGLSPGWELFVTPDNIHKQVNFMIMGLIAYTIIFFLVPLVSNLSSYLFFPIAYILEAIKIPLSIRMIIGGAVPTFIAVFLGRFVLNLFQKEVGLLLIIVLALHYVMISIKSFNNFNLINKSRSSKGVEPEIDKLFKQDLSNDKNMAIGHILGLILGMIYFI